MSVPRCHKNLKVILQHNFTSHYQQDYYTDLPTTGTKECDDVRNFNGSVFEELQRSTYRDLPHNVYCELIGTFDTQCLEQSLLEIWMYNEKKYWL